MLSYNSHKHISPSTRFVVNTPKPTRGGTRCTYTGKLGHNHSSSPFTTLADITERKVASTGAGQPNYWPKTWFRANAYSAKFGVPSYTVKVFGLLLPCCGALCSPWQGGTHRVYGCYLISLLIIKKRKTEKEQKHKAGALKFGLQTVSIVIWLIRQAALIQIMR